MATRYAGGLVFDHGAQFFTARSEAFREYLAPLIRAGVVADWPVQFAEFQGSKLISTRPWAESVAHYVGVPGMNAVGKWLAKDLHIVLDTPVARMSREDTRWRLYDDGDALLGCYDWVVTTAPAPQSANLANASDDPRSRAQLRRKCKAALR